MRHTIESRHTASLARSRVCLSPQPSGVAAHEFDEPGRGEKRISWKAEVIADSSGKWVGDTVRFATRREAWSCQVLSPRSDVPMGRGPLRTRRRNHRSSQPPVDRAWPSAGRADFDARICHGRAASTRQGGGGTMRLVAARHAIALQPHP